MHGLAGFEEQMAGMDFTEFSIRYAIICAVAVVAVYLLVSLLRLSQIRRRRQSLPAIERALKFDADGIYTLRRGTPAGAAEDLAPAGRRPAPAVEAADVSENSQFGEQLFRSSVEAELERMRSEVSGLKETIAQLKAARRVSPLPMARFWRSSKRVIRGRCRSPRLQPSHQRRACDATCHAAQRVCSTTARR